VHGVERPRPAARGVGTGRLGRRLSLECRRALGTRAGYCFAKLVFVADKLRELTRETFRVRSECRTDEEGRAHAATLSLEGIAGKIGCPLFIVRGQ
jgi:hypothetical protein